MSVDSQFSLESLDNLWQKHKTKFRSKKIESYVNFSRRITLPDGKAKGTKYRPESHQVQNAILQELDKGWRIVTIVKPVQDGGTLVSLIPLFRRVVDQYQTVVLAYPTLDSAKDIWTTKVLPIMRAFGGIEPTSGGGSEGGAARVVTLPTGGHFILRAAGGRGESQQASITGDCVQIDEVDDWPSIHRIRLVSLRVEESPDPLIIKICTVKKQQNSLILSEYDVGTRSRLFYACADCGIYQKIEWENVRWDETDYRAVPGSEKICCIHCGVMHGEHGRKIMLANWKLIHDGQKIDENGIVTGQPLSTDNFSILWTRIESPRKTLLSSVQSYLEAKLFLELHGDHGPMKSFFQDYLCKPYTGDLEELEIGGLIKVSQLIVKSSMSDFGPTKYLTDSENIGEETHGLYARHTVEDMPGDTDCTLGSMDVQHNRVYWVLTALNSKNGTTFDVCWGIEFARWDRKAGDEDEMFLLFDRVATLLRKLSKDLPFELGAIDCGDQPDIIRKWVGVNAKNWRAVRGDSKKKEVQENDIDGVSYIRDGVIYVQNDNVREQFQAAIRRPLDVPGAVCFPQGVGQSNSGYFKHLCSRQSSIDPKTKKKIVVRGPGREDWLDCRIYLTALVIGYLAAKRLIDDKRQKEDTKRVAANATTIPPQENLVVQHAVKPQQQTYRIGGHMSHSPANRRSMIGQNRRWR